MPSSQTDLTSGDVRRQLIIYATPIIITSLIQSLYALVDMVVVSRFIGSAGASAVNNAGQVTRMVTQIIIGAYLWRRRACRPVFRPWRQGKPHARNRHLFFLVCCFRRINHIGISSIQPPNIDCPSRSRTGGVLQLSFYLFLRHDFCDRLQCYSFCAARRREL
jgi:hypothetical protein